MTERDANQLAADATELRRRIDLLIEQAPQMDGPDWATAMLPLAFEASKELGDALALMGTLQQERDDLYEANWPWEWVIASREKKRREAAEAALAQARQALADGARIAEQYLDTGRGDLDGWADRARALADTGGDTKELPRPYGRSREDYPA